MVSIVLYNHPMLIDFYGHPSMCIELSACKCAPVSLARYESAPPDWRGIMKTVIVQT